MNTEDTIKAKIDELRSQDYSDEEIIVLFHRAFWKSINKKVKK
jgi:hypothetical protein